jgi:hypothetical protein
MEIFKARFGSDLLGNGIGRKSDPKRHCYGRVQVPCPNVAPCPGSGLEDAMDSPGRAMDCPGRGLGERLSRPRARDRLGGPDPHQWIGQTASLSQKCSI